MNASLSLFKNKTMTEFSPFQSWRYNAEKVRFDDVIAPPYDVISPSGQNQLYQRSPYNCIRLILNKEEASKLTKTSFQKEKDIFQKIEKTKAEKKPGQKNYPLFQQKFFLH